LNEFSSTIEWLIEDNHPMTKYNTLKVLLERPDNDSEVQKSLSKMMSTRPIGSILKNQNEDGGFFKKEWLKDSFYKRTISDSLSQLVKWGYIPKYKATIWQVRFLAEAEVPSSDTRISRLGEYVIKTVYEEEHGFFDGVLACVNGDMVWALCKFGFGNRPEVRKAFNLHVDFQKYENGDWTPPEEWPYYGKKGHCFGPCTCYNGITQLLRAMTIVPKSYWTKSAKNARENTIQFFKFHGVIRRDWKQTFTKSTPSYAKHRTTPILLFTAPIGAQSDPMEVATNLLMLGVKTDVVEEAIEFVMSKATKKNRWKLEATHSPMYSSWGKKGSENKWITFRVLKMLKLADKLQF
jgi:hypothetical protein